ncbi:MAG: UDP-N-acetylglucosamine 2-epimerase (hydrolyzing) [Deltaproteobacteria bacterium]|nr:UDP-N-acetylglucosamine 2-epimerase (hydrolyzing) [Deltaproteobacteria bacterium]
MKRKICVILTTRGNYAKMKPVMKAISKREGLELQVILGGGAVLPKYGDLTTIIRRDGFVLDRILHFLIEGENLVTMTQSAGFATIEMARAFNDLAPDIVLVIADRFEALSIAMSAFYMNIIVAHIEGGEVSGSIDESIRHAITKLSHLHFPANTAAAERIIKLGEDSEKVFVVGTTSLDQLSEIELEDVSSLFEFQRTTGVGSDLDFRKDFNVVLQHPVVTEYQDNLKNINETIAAVDELKIPTVWIWPNMDAGSDGIAKGIRMFREMKNPDYIHYFKSVPFKEYAKLLFNCRCLVGNSSSGIRESAFLGTPVVNIGTRQDGRDRGRNVLDVPYDRQQIKQAISRQMANGLYPSDDLYGDGRAGHKISEILATVDLKVQKTIAY